MVLLKVIGIILVVAIVAMGGMALWALSYHKKLKAVPVNDVDLSKVKDGTFEGRWDAGWWSKTIKVVVANHKITDLKITGSGNIPVRDAETKFLAEIVKKQSLKVDAIAGATITTQTILKSTELALEKGIN
jgi:uncharacterized protein with FMN-binding domain